MLHDYRKDGPEALDDFPLSEFMRPGLILRCGTHLQPTENREFLRFSARATIAPEGEFWRIRQLVCLQQS